MYCTKWCPDCRRHRQFLDENNVDYKEVNIESDPDAAKKVEEINNGKKSVPTIVLASGETLTNPGPKVLKDKLGL